MSSKFDSLIIYVVSSTQIDSFTASHERPHFCYVKVRTNQKGRVKQMLQTAILDFL